jgi:hypothetical protein
LKTFLSLILMLPMIANAAFPRGEAIRDELNATPYGEHVQLGTQLQSKKEHVLQAYYDFNRQGGAVGTIDLLDAKDMKKAVIPAGAILTGCLIHVLTAPTSSGSTTLGFSTGDRLEDIKDNTAKATFDTPDTLVGCDIAGLSTALKMPGYTDGYSSGYTKDYTPTMKINVSGLDGGKLSVWITYILNR